MVRAIRPLALEDLGFEAAVRRIVEEYSQHSGLAATLSTEGDLARLGSRLEYVLFRTIQEALHNVRSHARARAVMVSVAVDGGTARATVRDDGAGFDAKVIGHEIGMGLRHMRERVEGLGGYFHVHSLESGGTEVRADVPLQPRNGVTGT
jgi:two-component system NarL family sensor kinase